MVKDELKDCEILTQSYSISENELGYHEKLLYNNSKIVHDLMQEFYNKFLSSGKTYKTKYVEKIDLNKETQIKTVYGYLYVQRVEE